jgi:hypothetical protein
MKKAPIALHQPSDRNDISKEKSISSAEPTRTSETEKKSILIN